MPITASQGVHLPQVTMEHIHSIIGYFTGIPSSS
ncbi:DNA packaging ATPase [Yersinia phage vB_YenM_P8]